MQYVDNYTFQYLATFPTSIHNLLYFLTAKLLNISTPCIQNIDLERWLLKLGCLLQFSLLHICLPFLISTLKNFLIL